MNRINAIAALITMLCLLNTVHSRRSYNNRIYYKTKSGLTKIPGDIPDDAKEVYLYYNRISNVFHFRLSKLSDCEVLDLYSNRIWTIDDGTFSALPKLKKLYLGKNNLGDLTRDTFSGLYSLQLLDVSDNYLLSIEPCAFADVSRPVRLILSTREDTSTVKCDTRWCWLKKELDDGTIILQYEQGVCAMGTSYNSVDCAAEDLSHVPCVSKKGDRAQERTLNMGLITGGTITATLTLTIIIVYVCCRIRRKRLQQQQRRYDNYDDVSLLDAGDSPDMLDSPPPYSLEDEAVAPAFRSRQTLEEYPGTDATNAHPVDAAPSVPPPHPHLDQVSESETVTSTPPGAPPEHTPQE